MVVEVFKSVSGMEFKVAKEYLEIVESGSEEFVRICPSCGNMGLRVLRSNVGNHVDSRYWGLLDNNFWFCSTRDCDVVYFNNRKKIYFLKGEVNVPVFHKETGRDRPVCYCFNVTEQMIWDEIYDKGCCDTLEDIVAYTKAGSGRWCPITNPSGRCCKEYLEPLVEELLKGLPKEAKEQGKRVEASIKAEPSIEPLRLIELKVYGMTCQGCVSAVTSALEEVGGRKINVSLDEGMARATLPLSISPDDVIKAIEDSGYSAELIKEKRIT